ncbi:MULTISPECIES: helix-turn-helix transcriptional regulator [unclassified Devosia]|jgi:transcriptional regulator with XRE-family HTH domain|uniref:helix-turn-helix domain-containing protein n=1 Tax=unclassified Devosia TaxID=196773 RepID=UPI00086E2B2A|nr:MULTISPECIES: helix-turn-helix transcriptional regulator [unclassified Devosia]MBN9363590.1 helix-turn-helix transcriptional regulator [Devosia sp.]ODS80841.1 MAG: transcriptional regulator [Devosia sp. SCN 66-27]OJX25395.1 MAG: transcriptional regulator [Devosia sp. 66-14]
MTHAQATASDRSIGDYIRDWRQHRRFSQLSLALEIELSQKHLSFIESGRSIPSREVVLRIAAGLGVPLRIRNLMLLAAGYAPVYQERRLDHPDMEAARAAVGRVLKAYEPYPAVAVDRRWNLVASNDATMPLFAAVADAELLKPPVNVLRASLHPKGIAPLILNFEEWSRDILRRLSAQLEASGDPEIADLMTELRELTGIAPGHEGRDEHGGVFVPLKLQLRGGVASFISTTTVFGTPTEITLSELVIEAFLPADAETAALLAAMG